MSRSYEQHILDYIEEHPDCLRQDIIGTFPHLAQKTIYNNVNKLLAKKEIAENRYGALRILGETVRDTWPIAKVLTDFNNFGEITNAFALQDEAFKEWCETVATKYHTEINVLLVQLSIIYASIRKLDVYKGYVEKRPIDRELLNKEEEQLEKILDKFINVWIRGTNSAA